MERDYIVLKLDAEYPGYTGTEKWMIITDLAEEQFAGLYPDDHWIWKKAVVVSKEIGAEILRYRVNENKHRRRILRQEDPFGEEALEIEDEKVSEEFSNLWLRDALDALPPDQRRRVTKHYIQGFSEKAIAGSEGVNQSTVHRSIKKGIKNLQKYSDVHKEDWKDA